MWTHSDFAPISVLVVGLLSLAVSVACVAAAMVQWLQLRSAFSVATVLAVVPFAISDLGMLLVGAQLLSISANEPLRTIFPAWSIWQTCLLSSYRFRACSRSFRAENPLRHAASTFLVVSTLVAGAGCIGVLVISYVFHYQLQRLDDGPQWRKPTMLGAGILCAAVDLITAALTFQEVQWIRNRVLMAACSSSMMLAGQPQQHQGNTHVLSASSGGGGNGGSVCGGLDQRRKESATGSAVLLSAAAATLSSGLRTLGSRVLQERSKSSVALAPKFAATGSSTLVIGTAIATSMGSGSTDLANGGATPTVMPSSGTSTPLPAAGPPSIVVVGSTRASSVGGGNGRRRRLALRTNQALVVLAAMILLLVAGASVYATSASVLQDTVTGLIVRTYTLLTIAQWRLVAELFKR